ncbi:MAG: tetratricopeptide repeat protein, partial [bacterium]|nr:tetratricopeptide repeat protein [bacterium]
MQRILSPHKFKWFLAFVVLPFLVLFIGCFSNPDVLYLKAVKLIEKNKLARAEKLLFKVLRMKKNHPDAQYSLGVIYMKQERYSDSISRFKEVLSLNSVDVDALTNLGVIYARMNKLELAAEKYEEAVRISPGNNTILLNLARLHVKQKKYREARLLYENILRAQPNLFSANKELGFIYKAEGRSADAISQFSRASKLQPKDHEVLFELGHLYFRRGKNNTASKYYLKAISIKEESIYYAALANLYENTGQVEDCITAYQKSYQLDNDNYEAVFRLAVLTLNRGELKRAAQYLKIALRLKSNKGEVYKYFGVLLRKQKQFDKSKEAFLKAKLLNKYVREIYYQLGLIDLELNNVSGAIENFERELKDSPSHLLTVTKLASLYLDNKQDEKATILIRRALKTHKNDGELHRLLGQFHLSKAEFEKENNGLYIALEDYDEAIKSFKQSIRLNPERTDVLELLVKAYSGAKRFAVAIPFFNKLIQISPERWEYYPDLARGYLANQEYDKAIDILGKYLEVNKSDAKVWFQLGKIYADKGDFIDGIEIFKKAILIEPNDPKKKLFLGMLQAEVNRFDAALKTLRK